ncbi:hypothetical protein [Ectobacillus ponti]|uniref:Uncharacterized protein n=1 Tax=Ectobacillus ponti TaxID=2961894 RepID=A0AA41XBZ0_9BACI|nr:hypothetical protein [Ectobacillus ponti]MCP8970088.1 hypothetical protein [Ectobacillus ponti]
MRKKVMMGLGCILLGAGGYLVHAASNGSPPVSVKEGMEVAKSLIQRKSPEIHHSELVFVRNIYDVDDIAIAYQYDMITAGQRNGYIVIGSRTDLPVLLAYAPGSSLEEMPVSQEKKLYYVGPMQFLAAQNKEQLQAAFQAKKNKMLELFRQNRKEQTSEFRSLQRRELQPIQRDAKYKEKWGEIRGEAPGLPE